MMRTLFATMVAFVVFSNVAFAQKTTPTPKGTPEVPSVTVYENAKATSPAPILENGINYSVKYRRPLFGGTYRIKVQFADSFALAQYDKKIKSYVSGLQGSEIRKACPTYTSCGHAQVVFLFTSYKDTQVNGNTITYYSDNLKNHQDVAQYIVDLLYRADSKVAIPVTVEKEPRPNPSTSSKSEAKPKVKATVTTLPEDSPLPRQVLINFSQVILNDVNSYRVLGLRQTEIEGSSKLINELYYEPGLLATTVKVAGNQVELIFAAKRPGKTQLANILNRVIKIVQKNSFPTQELEVDNYDPLLGADSKKPTFIIPPPIRRIP